MAKNLVTGYDIYTDECGDFKSTETYLDIKPLLAFCCTYNRNIYYDVRVHH